MRKVLIVGHACDPGKGSEHASTWNWAWYLSRYADITLLTHPSNRPGVERYISANPNPRLHFEWVHISRALDPWRPARSDWGIHAHYVMWQRAARRRAADLIRQQHIDLVHHVGWGSVSAPPGLWKLGKPFVWGPVGGGQTTPTAFLGYFGMDAATEALRSLRVRMMPYTPAVRAAARHSRLVLATNPESMRILERAGAQTVVPLLDSGVPSGMVLETIDERPPGRELRLLWAGAMEPRKALPIALEAVAARPDIPSRLTVAGAGPMREQWQRYGAQLGISDRVDFLGWVPWKQMPQLYRNSDAFLFTSLRDSFAAVNLEAMAHGLPVITLDHQGVGAFVPEAAGIKVPVYTPRQCIVALGEAIATVHRHPERRAEWGRAGLEFARTQTWELRAERMHRFYEQIAASPGPAVECRHVYSAERA